MTDESTNDMPEQPVEPMPAPEPPAAPEAYEMPEPPAPPAEPVAPPAAPGYAPPPPPPAAPAAGYTPSQPGYAPTAAPAGDKQKLVAGILAILLGSLGIHKFYLGYNKEGAILLAVSVISFGMLAAVSSIVGIIEGIMYLTKTDEEFYATYVAGRKAWF